MAENEIPRWAQAALERNERIQSKARSAVALMKLLEEQDRLSRLAPDTLGTVDPNYSEEVRYEAPGAIRDPESWLNRGLGTLAGNAADVILGRPSENPVVDYGLAPIPGVGAAAILGAGGQPGLVDAAGLGGFFGGLGRIAKAAVKESPKSAVAMFKGLGALTPKQVAELEAARQRGKVPDITDPRHLPVVPYEMERMVLPEERTLEEAADAIVGNAERDIKRDELTKYLRKWKALGENEDLMDIYGDIVLEAERNGGILPDLKTETGRQLNRAIFEEDGRRRLLKKETPEPVKEAADAIVGNGKKKIDDYSQNAISLARLIRK
ncbi:MAG: hypothetical protein IIV41_07965, partial [Akkermansia sp.]|nr:hypothetical protein [Akkermansia sp.]